MVEILLLFLFFDLLNDSECFDFPITLPYSSICISLCFLEVDAPSALLIFFLLGFFSIFMLFFDFSLFTFILFFLLFLLLILFTLNSSLSFSLSIAVLSLLSSFSLVSETLSLSNDFSSL